MFRLCPLTILVLLWTIDANEALTQHHHGSTATIALTQIANHHQQQQRQLFSLKLQKSHPRILNRQRRSYLDASTNSVSENHRHHDQSSWTRWITGVSNPQRPAWARDWMPTWLVRLRPSLQLVTVLLCYIFHMTVLAQHSLPFPIQLIPNERGNFQNIGLDSLAGMATLGAYSYFQRTTKSPLAKTTTTDRSAGNSTATTTTEKDSSVLPKLWSTPKLNDSPWKNIYRSKYSRVTSFLALCALFHAYFWTGRFSLWWEDTFYYLANFYPITVPMHRSLCVLFGHLTWIVLGGSILRVIPRPQSFFDNIWYTQRYFSSGSSSTTRNESGDDESNNSDIKSYDDGDDDGDSRGAAQWVWWTVGGYFVSSWLFNVADFVNQSVLPVAILQQAQESVVSQLINPEMNDWWASAVGYIAPCITAPWWEEVLYRGFLLPALMLQMKYKWAILWSGIIFAVHHLSPTACIPLTILGWTWSILYAKSGNLLTTILVHAMWNSRIFLGSWLGL